MKLFLLDDPNSNDYDAFSGFVIRAETEEAARLIANKASGDEGPIWADPKKTTCVELTADGEAGIIMSDFHAG